MPLVEEAGWPLGPVCTEGVEKGKNLLPPPKFDPRTVQAIA